jgi:hypothetical protein
MQTRSFVHIEVWPIRHAWSSIGRMLIGLSLAAMLTLVATSGVSPAGNPHLAQPTGLIDPPEVR